MFDRFIRLQRARKALREQRFEDALQFANDPLVRDVRQAEEIRGRCRDALLARGRQRLAAEEFEAGRALLRRLQPAVDDEAVRAFAAELEAAAGAARAATDAARGEFDEARRLLERGELTEAGARLRAPMPERLRAEAERLAAQIDERRRRAAELLTAAEGHLDRSEVEPARQAWQRAQALDRAVAAPKLAARLAAAMAERAQALVGARLDAGDPVGALGEWRKVAVEASGLALGDALRPVASRLERSLLEALRAARELGAGTAIARAAAAAEFAASGALAELLVALDRCAAPGRGVEAAALQELRRTARAAKADRLAAVAAEQLERHGGLQQRLGAARARSEAGDLDVARQLLVEIVAEDPMHEGARRELELVEQGIGERGERLGAARAAAREGRLRDACAAALALGTGGRLGDEAQLLLTDVRARMALVDRGLEETMAALHGRAAGSTQGVRHCLMRLEELAKVQVDHPELQRVVAAVAAEVQGLSAHERGHQALTAGRTADAIAAVDDMLGLRPQLLAPERLDARLAALADGLGGTVEQALAAGGGRELEAGLACLERLAAVVPEFAVAAGRMRQEVAERSAAAVRCAQQAELAIGQRDLAEAERLLEEAQGLWAEAAGVRALAERLRGLRQQADALAEVAALTKGRDFRGAADRLADLPPTPPMLRTRIYDMKLELARAQGLEAAFLLRVDEGGEHLVLRGESVSIGNLRKQRADLPILANIAGRHATIRRSMSFHGGMEDRIVAEDGEVEVGGRKVREQRLAPGDRIRFGSTLAAVYERPTSRSLTAALVLQGGFQVAGTERVLLMKDRGRDGRILIGPSPDVHIRVAGAATEVEVFTTSSGQVRVACGAGGTIDGKAFKGDHPVDAGQVVVAGGVTFVLLPWRPA